ncbi:Ger(x)C family spore germination protein [Clostridium aciditolerans]|uniref:Ger(X)C family spore germination protein n=1 Tax=Clostridium aciditolerans TaxID=339861 RepID=A0A934M0V0_9CLOT|nr:Ger(x)C family spore germination protein [Clostridium aciditolerans]MBI6872564.1 Ger(x)C family spore germination protein [Clostridium aciditolerans]
MKFIKLSILFIYIISNVFLSTGCWNYREVEQLGLAAGVSIDKDDDNNNYIVTAELINTEPSRGSTKVSSQLFSARGKTIFDAVRNLILITGKKIYWGHTKVIIINENIASNGIVPVIDWVNRDSEPRQDTWILISHGITARDVLKQKIPLTDVTSLHLNEIIRSQNPVYKFPQMDIWRFRRDISSNTTSAIAPVVKIEKINEFTFPEIYGTAVFKQDKLVGYLDGEETMDLLFIKNKIHEGSLILKQADNTSTDISLEIFKSKTKINSIYQNENFTLDINIDTVVAIDEVAGTKNFIDEPGRIKLEKDAEQLLKTRIEILLKKVQTNYKSDIFGFGDIIKRQHSDIWKSIPYTDEKVFSKMQFNVNVDLTIKGSGKISKPIRIGE